MLDPLEDESRRELEHQVADLKRDKMRVEQNIRRMEASQQRLLCEDPAELPQRKRSRSRLGGGTPKRKEEKDEEEDQEEVEQRREEREREGRQKKKRGDEPRRKSTLFGQLLGHLHSAKQQLESEKGSKAAELHQRAQDRIEEKLSLSKMNIKEFRRAQFGQQRREEEEKAMQIDKLIEEKDMRLLQSRLESHYGDMMNFIRTKAEPTIFYLPAKHTRESEQALEETRAAIRQKIASLKAVEEVRDDEEGEAAGAAEGGDPQLKEAKEAVEAAEVEQKRRQKLESEKKHAPSEEEEKVAIVAEGSEPASAGPAQQQTAAEEKGAELMEDKPRAQQSG